MIVHVDELAAESLENLQHAPLFGMDVVEMKLHQDLIDVIQVFGGEKLQDFVFAALTVDLEDDVLLCEVVPFEHIFEGVKRPVVVNLIEAAHTFCEEGVPPVIRGALSNSCVIAIVLIVRNSVLSANEAAEAVEAVDADVDDPLGSADVVFAGDVVAVLPAFISPPLELAVSVLNPYVRTLYGCISRLIYRSNFAKSFFATFDLLYFCPGRGIPTVG